MPKSKKQLEHTHTYDGRKYMISFDPRGLKDNQRDQIHYSTEENIDQNWTGSRLTHSIVN